MDYDITIIGAFTAGILSFISPCVLPLVPPYMAYIAGVNITELMEPGPQEGDAASPEPAALTKRMLAIALVFVLGFSTIFVALGASASAIGQLLRQYMDILATVAGIIIIIMGLHFLGLFRLAFLMREYRMEVNAKPATYLGAYIMGLAFALGWTPCIGPVLAAILAVAAQEESVARGALLLSVYSAGLGVPFLVAAALMKPFIGLVRRFSRYLGLVEKAMGVFLVITGVLFLTGGMQTISAWLIDAFPALIEVG